MNLGNSLWLVGILVEAIVLFLLFSRGIWRTLPVFSFYCLWDLTSNGLVLPFTNHWAHGFLKLFLGLTIADAIFVLAVLTEVFWSVLRPLHSSLPRATRFVLLGFFSIVAIFAWPLTAVEGFGKLTSLIIHIQQVSSLLRIVVFVLLAACSQFLSLGWRDREFQVATGLGIYSLVSFGAMLIHAHKTDVSQYSSINQFVVASYLCSLLYWVYSFAQKEAERRAFTPQMQDLLLAVAGVAREQRL
ncbi:MAG: hypothetical protein WCA37_17100, partial [Terracidiphilus sp.]